MSSNFYKIKNKAAKKKRFEDFRLYTKKQLNMWKIINKMYKKTIKFTIDQVNLVA